MPRPGYLALAWAARDAQAAARAADAARRMRGEGGWRQAGGTGRLVLWVRDAAAPTVRVLPQAAGFVIGDLFPMPDAAPAVSPLADAMGPLRSPLQVARRLSRSHWGRYVALLHGPPDATAVYRDPSGDLDCLTWAADGLAVAVSDLALAPAWLRPPRLSLNWDRIASFLAVPTAATAEPLFDGVEAVGPGMLHPLGAGAESPCAVWTPAAFVDAAPCGPGEAAAALVERVDRCTAALAGGYDSLIVELSGGLDSAIVAGSLAQAGLDGRVAQWLNRVGDRPEGDERAYARAVTDRLGARLTTAAKPLTPLDEAGLAELAAAAWPAINGADAARDRDEVERIAATGAGAIVSGQGGDAVFYQMPTAQIAADEVRRRGLAALGSPVLANVARRTRQSVWSVLREAHAGRRYDPAVPSLVSPLLGAEAAAATAGAAHPWVRGAAEVPAAKRMQIHAIANGQVNRGDCRRRRAADLLFPLLAQPVVELCLAIPARDLAGGPQDRSLARAAFAGRVPEAILRRRSKGSLTSYYARLVAGSLETLRPFLLDGCLCGAGLLDRRALDAALDPRQLIHTPQSMPILTAAVVEAWVRHWQGRAPDSPRSPRGRPWPAR